MCVCVRLCICVRAYLCVSVRLSMCTYVHACVCVCVCVHVCAYMYVCVCVFAGTVCHCLCICCSPPPFNPCPRWANNTLAKKKKNCLRISKTGLKGMWSGWGGGVGILQRFIISNFDVLESMAALSKWNLSKRFASDAETRHMAWAWDCMCIHRSGVLSVSSISTLNGDGTWQACCIRQVCVYVLR